MTTAVATPPADHQTEEHHEHPAWLAHHFDDAEQQYDAGKLGMWLFLVTEVLFFSGMFCAYALYRNRNPEVFEFCSTFLNEKLGAINTGVLLFSSLTMAWAVRASQLKQTKTLIGMLAATLGCAAIFLGVKAVEYSHKWGLGLFPGKFYVSQIEGAHHSDVPYLWYLCIPPLVLLVCFLLYYVYGIVSASKFHLRVAGPLVVAAGCYFAGVGLGVFLEAEAEESHSIAHAPASHTDHATADHSHAATLPEAALPEATSPEAALPEVALPEATVPAVNLLGPEVSPSHDVAISPAESNTPDSSVNQKGMAGLFFSIYYCMTGVHAFHILGGMAVITWLIVKSAKFEFHSKYYGPVDNVGLYWHLVDFIWIYLFPLLYLIT